MNILQSLKNLNAVLPEPPSTEEEFLAEEFSKDGPAAPMPNDLEAKVIKINKNTNQKLIIVTQDKTLLCLKRNISRLGKHGWVAPLSTVTTIIVALITADFRTALWLGPSEWKAMFVIAGFLATGWLALTVRRSARAFSTNEAVYNIVNQLGGKMNGMS